MKYRIAIKASPADPNAEAESLESLAPESEAPAPPQDDARPWAGDPYDEGDETPPDAPSVTAVFVGEAGEEAWLERATDGTLTGWVRDATGQVWRYVDPDAWAVDVDDAKMAPQGGAAAVDPGQEEEQEPPAESEESEQQPDDSGALTLDGFK